MTPDIMTPDKPAVPDIRVRISESPVYLHSERNAIIVPTRCGGLVSFEGIVRDTNLGRPVEFMIYEAYEALAIKEITKIGGEAAAQFGLAAVYVVHRIGRLEIGATAVVVTAIAGHRGEAFLGCKYVIDHLKVRAPLWKKEFYADGTHSWPRCSEHDHAACSAHTHERS